MLSPCVAHSSLELILSSCLLWSPVLGTLGASPESLQFSGEGALEQMPQAPPLLTGLLLAHVPASDARSSELSATVTLQLLLAAASVRNRNSLWPLSVPSCSAAAHLGNLPALR